MSGRANNYRSGEKGFPKDEAEGMRWQRKAAEAGDVSSMFLLGSHFENTFPPDVQEAIKWYRKAAAAGNDDAKERLRRLGQSP